MERKVSLPAAALAKALRSLETGGLTYSDALDEIKTLLATGASPTELREVLEGRELIEPLSEHARVELFGLIEEAIQREKEQSAASDGPAEAADKSPGRTPAPTNAGLKLVANSPPTAGAHAASPFTGARVDALVAELAAARAEVEAERRKTRSAAQMLADRTASMEAAQARAEQALRESERHQADAEALRNSFDARNAQLAALTREHNKATQALQTREAELAALTQEHTKVVQALDARSTGAAQLEADLRAARAAESALSIDLTAARNALESEQSRAKDRTKALTDRITSIEAALAVSEDALQQAERRQNEARSRATALAVELAAARTEQESVHLNALKTSEAISDRIKLAEEARFRTEEALRDLESARTEAHRLRETLAARGAELAALQQEHLKVKAALETRKKSAGDQEAEVEAARARISSLSLELKASKEAAAGLTAQVGRGESLLATLRTELEAAKAQSKSYLDLLRTRDAGHDELQAKLEATEAFVEKMRADSSAAARRVAESNAASARAAELRAQQAEHLAQRHAAQTVELESARAARVASGVPERPKSTQVAHHPTLVPAPGALTTPTAAGPASGGGPTSAAGSVNPTIARQGLPGTTRRTLAIAAAVIIAILIWFSVHHSPPPAPIPAVSVSTESPASAVAPVGIPHATAPPEVSRYPGTLVLDCPTCPAMTILPAGRFKQGTPRGDGDVPAVEAPQHWVSIRRPFALSTSPITVEEFGQFVAATGRDMQGCDTYDGSWKHQADRSWKAPGFVQAENHPATCISALDAEAYASWLSAKTGNRYRLPSASEWEYAARSGSEAATPWGASGSSACANANVADQSAARRYPGWRVFDCDDNYIHTSPVGSFKANAFGLNDMLGNVFQWTEDCWHADYTNAPVDGSARTDGECAERELRGGSWFTSPGYVRANYRNHFPVDYRTSTAGIRLARDLAQ